MRMRTVFIISYLFSFIILFTFCSENSTATIPEENETGYNLGPFLNTTISLPTGAEVNIDGRIDEAAWDEAHTAQLAEGEQVLLMYSGGYLYVGFRTKVRPVTTVFFYRNNSVYVLHSSSAVGSAIYEFNGNGWTRTKEFCWYCRDGSSSESAENARQQFLADEGWLANIAFAGSETETEFKIAMNEETLLIAAGALGEPYYDELSIWPSNTNDKCKDSVMLTGPIPESAQFIPENWIPVNRPN